MSRIDEIAADMGLFDTDTPLAATEPTAGPSDLVIVVHGTPAPQGSKRHVGHGVMVESSAKVKPWREAVKWAALQARDDLGYPDDPGLWRDVFTGPVLVDVTFELSRPRSHYRTGANASKLRAGAPIWPAGRPDLDKLLRSTLDALGEASVWRDDAQVVAVTARKSYGQPGAKITVRRLGP